jgi:hypothetical protein
MKTTFLGLFLLAALLSTACSSSKTTYVDPGSSRLITTTEGINIQDFSQAADTMVNSLIDQLINPGALRSGAPNQPALLALLRTGKVQTSTTIAYGGPEDPLAAEELANNQFFNDRPTRRPDYTLSGKIIEDRTRAGNIRQSAYIFQLALTDVREGVAVWEDEKTIVKQGSRPTVGF